MKEPKITIVTPSFNQGRFIEQTIQSVLDQQYPNLEYIIIDGGSTDGTVDIIKKYEKHITYWVSERDNGQSDAINKGLQLATGEVVNWLNSDDYYELGALKTVAEAFQDQNVTVVCGRGRIFYQNKEGERFSRGTDVYEGNLAKTIGWARMDQPETFFRRSVLEKVGELDSSLHYLMDRDLWIRYLCLYGLEGVKKIPDVLVNFRLHASSKTVSQNEKFQIDHDSFFYSICRQFKLVGLQEIIESACEVHESFTLRIPAHFKKNDVEKIMSYYFLKRADEFYTTNERVKAKLFLVQVDPNHLAVAEQSLLKKLNFRNTFVSLPILKFFRRGRL